MEKGLKTLKSSRLHIGIFGKRNVGKSSIINEVTHQNTSIVSDIAGTTTDAVEKSMEMLPLGPVVFIDTAGIDDIGALGKERIKKTNQIIDRTDIALIVCDHNGWDEYEFELSKKFKERDVKVIGIINKSDEGKISDSSLDVIKNNTDKYLITSVKTDKDIELKVKEALVECVPDEFINPPSLVEGVVEENDFVILVTPIDKEAPKGRMILPEMQVLRAMLDANCQSMVVQEAGLKRAIENMKIPPKIVVTDSQAFQSVNKIVPANIPLTSFSILYARAKGNIEDFVEGAKAIDNLKDGAKILICESCTHHRIEDDIGTVKIPRWLKAKTGKDFVYKNYSSHQFPEDAGDYDLIIHCGGCMTNRREILSRILKSKKAGVPITNYGIVISYALGILDRAIEAIKK